MCIFFCHAILGDEKLLGRVIVFFLFFVCLWLRGSQGTGRDVGTDRKLSDGPEMKLLAESVGKLCRSLLAVVMAH